MYLDSSGNVIENASLVGYKAIGVPGSVAGLAYALSPGGFVILLLLVGAVAWATSDLAGAERRWVLGVNNSSTIAGWVIIRCSRAYWITSSSACRLGSMP